MIQLGGTVIPKGRSFWDFTCHGNETSKWPIESITVFGSILHMHATGDMMYTEILKADGTPRKKVNSVQYFDFDHQDPTLITPYQVHRGDTLKTRCYYNNPGTQVPLVFGLGSEQEMCIDFLYYYPYNAGIKDHCTFGNSGHFGGTYDGYTVITDKSDPGMRAFGVDVGTEDDPTCVGGASTQLTVTLPTADGPSSPSAGEGAAAGAAASIMSMKLQMFVSMVFAHVIVLACLH